MKLPCARFAYTLFALFSSVSPLALGHGIIDILSSTRNLAGFNSIMKQHPDILNALSTSKGIFFAPSNTALDSFIRDFGGPTAITPDSMHDLVDYLYSPDALWVYSKAEGKAATLTQHGLGFDGGIVHVVDQILAFSQPGTLMKLLETIQRLDPEKAVGNATASMFTSLDPTAAAFVAAGIDLSILTNRQFVDILKRQSGAEGYPNDFETLEDYTRTRGLSLSIFQ